VSGSYFSTRSHALPEATVVLIADLVEAQPLPATLFTELSATHADWPKAADGPQRMFMNE
jgi:hypothetical protein